MYSYAPPANKLPPPPPPKKGGKFIANNTKRILAVDKVTGDQYVIGTTTVLDGYGELKEKYMNYTFRIEDLNPYRGKLTFRIVRCREVIGTDITMNLIFEA